LLDKEIIIGYNRIEAVRNIKIYLDTCCYNRPFDDGTQENIRLEADAIIKIIELAKNHKFEIVSSEFVKYEIEKISNVEKRSKVLKLFYCDYYFTLSEQIEKAARYYRTFNIKTFDSLHLAVTEVHRIDFLLTTDLNFINFSTRFEHFAKVMSPTDFLAEVINNGL
jgi:predicted nucleic acid-binding protein